MQTPEVDKMIKTLDFQVNESTFTTQKNIDLLAELKAIKQAITVKPCCTELCGICDDPKVEVNGQICDDCIKKTQQKPYT